MGVSKYIEEIRWLKLPHISIIAKMNANYAISTAQSRKHKTRGQLTGSRYRRFRRVERIVTLVH